MIYPAWTWKLNEAKATYLFARQERHRTLMLESDLVTMSFKLYYKGQFGENEEIDEGEEDDNVADAEDIDGIDNIGAGMLPLRRKRGYDARFFEDHTMTAGSHPEQVFQWELVDGGRAVRVERFPEHCFSRMPNGSWILENHYVVFKQHFAKKGAEPREIPLF